MKLRRTSRVDRLEAFSAHRREQIRQLGEVVEDLQTTVAKLQQASHDHCEDCGRRTPEYGMTECGRTHEETA